MPVKVKICGVRTPAIIEESARAGADFVGLVLFEKSPRHVELEEARVLAAIARGKVKTVAVLVDPDDALVVGVAERVRPDLIQLHGSETPERVSAVKAMTGLPVMKAIPVAAAADVGRAGDYAGIADYILFDAKAAPDAPLAGGNGVPFDWHALIGAKAPFALSGGLTPETVGEAIRVTGASLVDVSSGVERARGEKDAKLIVSFITAAKAASPESRAKAS
ncbi:phosphoribosylanthranilate isomerase [Methyloceanibacter sp.]|uniref:phosphoribosylanthranilate isomerase n=1 Tax=Methyloceanibacter sp. TaxID=1965321 RepID=UPI002D739E22|nr:phosphoribosylanthranilate isomerase [Methyloceanibacter sp.]HZP08865.1 phosphoribosylanthranilate isomerase [Methyloceanibacter sp.]